MEAIVIYVANTMATNNTTPYFMVSTNSGVAIAHHNELIFNNTSQT